MEQGGQPMMNPDELVGSLRQVAVETPQRSIAEKAQEAGQERRRKVTEWFGGVLKKVDTVVGFLGSKELQGEAADAVWKKVVDAKNEVVGVVVDKKNEVVTAFDEGCRKAQTKIEDAAKFAANTAKEAYRTGVNEIARDVVAPIYESVNGKINEIKADAVDAVHEVGAAVVGFVGETAFNVGWSAAEKTMGKLALGIEKDANALMEKGSGGLLEKVMNKLNSKVYDVRNRAFRVADFGSALRGAAAEIRQSQQKQAEGYMRSEANIANNAFDIRRAESVGGVAGAVQGKI